MLDQGIKISDAPPTMTATCAEQITDPLATAQQEIERLKAERNAFCADVARALKELDQPKNPFDAEHEWFAHQVWGLVKVKVGDAQREIERLQGLVKSAYFEGAIAGRHCGRVTYNALWRGSRFPGALSAAPTQPTAPKTAAAAMEKALNEIYDVATSGLHTEDALMQCGRHAMRALGLGKAAPQSSEAPAELPGHQNTENTPQNSENPNGDKGSGLAIDRAAERDFEAEASRVWDEKWGEGYKYVWVSPDDGKCVFSTQAPDACHSHQYVNTLAAKDMIKDSMRLHGHTYDTD